MTKRLSKPRPMRFNEKKGYTEIQTGTRWRKAEETVCDNCHKTFYKPVSELNRYGVNFCTISCASSRRNHKYWLKSGAGGTVAKWCSICGTRFMVSASKYDRYSTCGKPECKHKKQSLNTLEYHRKRREASHDRATNISQ